jgi:hypothetical protein
MYEDEILREVWRVKDKLAAEYARDPNAYWAKLRQIGREWKRRGGAIATRTTARRKVKRANSGVSPGGVQ